LAVGGGLNPLKFGGGKWRRNLVTESVDHLWCRILAVDSGVDGSTNS
jgi:hypothetical protein